MTGSGDQANNKNIWLRQAIFESALILVGIVLGFWVNEWREDIEKEARGKAALARITEEIQDNRAALERVMPYHTQVLENLGKLENNVPDAPMIETFLSAVATEGVGDILLQDAAWKIATARDSLVSVDFDIVQQIASVYNLAESGTQSSWNSVVGLFSEKEAFLPEAATYVHKRYLFAYSNLVSQEKYLIYNYDQLLEKLGADTAAESNNKPATLQ